MTDPIDPTGASADLTSSGAGVEADEVRRMLQDRSRSISPRGTFADIEQRISAADGSRRADRTLLGAAAAVVLIALVAGAVAYANRDGDGDGTQRVDLMDSTSTSTTATTDVAPTTATAPVASSTTEQADPTETTETTEPDDATGGPDTSDAPGVTAISEQTQVRIDGFGPISTPMSVADAAAATGQPIAVDPNSIIDESYPCRFAQDPSFPEIWYMVDRDRITRVDITGSSPNRTEAGVGVGSTKAEVLAAYPGQVTEEPHPYAMDESSRYLVVTDPAHPDHSITFSVHQGRVQDYRAGLRDWVAMPEGCV